MQHEPIYVNHTYVFGSMNRILVLPTLDLSACSKSDGRVITSNTHCVHELCGNINITSSDPIDSVFVKKDFLLSLDT